MLLSEIISPVTILSILGRSIVFLILLLIPFVTIHAGEDIQVKKPVVGAVHHFDGALYDWIYNYNKGQHSLEIISTSSEVKAKYNFNCGGFCKDNSEEDNCDKDGFSEITLNINENPHNIIGVACHIGAHSQKFMIFDPSENTQSPVFEVIGAYYIDYDIRENDVKITYDSDEKEFYDYWPSKKMSENLFYEIFGQ
jgi:hypothetical protein